MLFTEVFFLFCSLLQTNPAERSNFESIHAQLQEMLVEADDEEEDDSDEESTDKENGDAVAEEATSSSTSDLLACPGKNQPTTMPDGAATTAAAAVVSTPTSVLKSVMSPGHRKTRSADRYTPPMDSQRCGARVTLDIPPVLADLDRSHSLPGSPHLSPSLTPRRRSLRSRVHTDSISTPSHVVDALRVLRARHKKRPSSASGSDKELARDNDEHRDTVGDDLPKGRREEAKVDKSKTL